MLWNTAWVNDGPTGVHLFGSPHPSVYYTVDTVHGHFRKRKAPPPPLGNIMSMCYASLMLDKGLLTQLWELYGYMLNDAGMEQLHMFYCS